jgi:probable O-glycosylation ligase (exosortase A-associated)
MRVATRCWLDAILLATQAPGCKPCGLIMRDLVVVAIVAAILPFVLRRPHIGILAFVWISVMNPHRLTYGFAYNLPFALLFFGVTLIAWILNRDERRLPPLNLVTILLLLLTIWITVTSFHAWVPEEAWMKYDRSVKIIAAAFLTAILIDRKERIIQLVAVIALSLAFYGTKGGAFTLLTGGENRVWGAPDSFLTDNNALAMALVMALPLIYFLVLEATNRWLRLALVGILLLTFAAVIGTYSRGGLLALAGIAGLLWLRMNYKLPMILAAVVIGLVGYQFLPGAWHERMSSIQNFTEDPSFLQRVQSWSYAIEVADESPVLGGGFSVFADNLVKQEGGIYAPLNAHSNYFEMLAEHGYVGLALYLLLLLATFFACSWIMMRARGQADKQWASNLASSIQMSVAGYAIGGAALNMAFYDLFYFLIAIVIALLPTVKTADRSSQSSDRGAIVHSLWTSNAPASSRP